MYDEYDKMMSNMNSRDKEALYTTKEEGDLTAAPSSSRQWSSSGLKNPRIVRVSRTFGGKDRHSKVCTIKGLRDRRIRLSVPTAIQLYDLQDRLNLGQPSKVIDWLLDITKHDIDKLPPLPAIPGTFAHFQQDTHHPSYGTSSSNPFIDASLFQSARKESSFNIHRDQSMVDVNEDPSIVEKLKYWDVSDATMRSKQKEIDDENHQGNNSQVLAQNFFPIASGSNNNNNNNNNNNSSSILPPSTYLSNNSNQAMYNYYHWEPSNLLSLSQLGSHGLMPSQNDQQGHHSSHSSSLPSPLALSSGSQLFMSPSMSSTSSLFPPPHASYVSNLHHQQAENHDIRQFNRFHHPMSNYPFTTSPFYTTTTSTNGMGLKPFPLSMNHHQHDEDDHDKNEDDG